MTGHVDYNEWLKASRAHDVYNGVPGLLPTSPGMEVVPSVRVHASAGRTKVRIRMRKTARRAECNERNAGEATGWTRPRGDRPKRVTGTLSAACSDDPTGQSRRYAKGGGHVQQQQVSV